MRDLVFPTRFERVTYSLGGCRSILLSYGNPVGLIAGPRSNLNPSAPDFPRLVQSAGRPGFGGTVGLTAPVAHHRTGLACRRKTPAAAPAILLAFRNPLPRLEPRPPAGSRRPRLSRPHHASCRTKM